MKKYVYSEAKQVVVCGDFAGASVELCQGCFLFYYPQQENTRVFLLRSLSGRKVT